MRSVIDSMAIICIAGKNDIAANGLEYVHGRFAHDHEVAALPNAGDPGRETWQKSLLLTARNLGVAVVEDIETLYGRQELIFVSLECDQLIKVDLFRSRELFNIHFSMLPAYRGMYTSVLPILHGQATSGVTLHVIDAGIDTGDIVDQATFRIDKDDTARDLYLKYNANAFDLLRANVDRLVAGGYEARPQDVAGASYFSKGSVDFGNLKVDLRKTAFEVKNQIRAYSFREYQMPVVFDRAIGRAEILPARSTMRAGSVVSQEAGFLIVSTIDYDVKLHFDEAGH